MRITAIDYETANENSLSACSIGYVTMDAGTVVAQGEYLIKPPVGFDYFLPFNVSIHHITSDMVQNQPAWPKVYEKIQADWDQAILLAHNAPFDMGILASLQKYYGLKMPRYTYLDTVPLARRLFPYLPNVKLSTVCEYLQVNLQHHQAGSDAWGCLQILLAAMDKYGIYDVEKLIATAKITTKQMGIRSSKPWHQ